MNNVVESVSTLHALNYIFHTFYSARFKLNYSFTFYSAHFQLHYSFTFYSARFELLLVILSTLYTLNYIIHSLYFAHFKLHYAYFLLCSL